MDAAAEGSSGPSLARLRDRRFAFCLLLAMCALWSVALPIGFVLAVAVKALFGDLDAAWFTERWILIPMELAAISAGLWLWAKQKRLSGEIAIAAEREKAAVSHVALEHSAGYARYYPEGSAPIVYIASDWPCY